MKQITITVSSLTNEITDMVEKMLSKDHRFKKDDMKKAAENTIKDKFGDLPFSPKNTVKISRDIWQLLILESLERFLKTAVPSK